MGEGGRDMDLEVVVLGGDEMVDGVKAMLNTGLGAAKLVPFSLYNLPKKK